MYTEISNPTEYKAAIYIRLSKEDDNETESQSVTNQREIIKEFTRQKSLDVYDEYVDDGFSGGNFDRPGFNRLIEDIESKKVNTVITKDLSRLGRDYILTGYYLEKYFPENRVRYISVLDGIDTGIDSTINDITPFKAIMNDMYAKDISKKIKSVKRDKQRKGLFIGGKAPYGYLLSKELKNTLIIDVEAAEVVRMMFQMALSGKSCREITMYLNENKIPSPAKYANLPPSSRVGPYNGLWSSERVTATLRNQMYIGNMVQGRTRKINYKSAKTIKLPQDEWTIVNDTHPAIIEKSDFNKVQMLIDSRARTRVRKHDYLLKGLIFCKECGYPLTVIRRVLSGNRPVLYFVCRTYQRFTKLNICTCHSIREEIVTNIVVEQIRNICKEYIECREFDHVAQEAIKKLHTSKRCEEDFERLVKKLDVISSNIDKIYEDKIKGMLDEEDFQRFYLKLREDRAVLQSKMESLKLKMESTGEPLYDVKSLTEKFIDSANKNRELLCSLIEKIELTTDKEVHITFRFSKLKSIQRA